MVNVKKILKVLFNRDTKKTNYRNKICLGKAMSYSSKCLCTWHWLG